MGEDLFWAIRGGGGASFAVILSYKIKLVSVPARFTVFRVEKTLEENTTDMVFRWQFVAPTTDNNLFMRMNLQAVTINKKQTVRALVMALYLGEANTLVSLLAKDFPELGLKQEDCIETSWICWVLWWASFKTSTSPDALLDRKSDSAKFLKRKPDYVQKPIPKFSLNLLWKTRMKLGKTELVFNAYGERMNDISISDTPFPHRAGNLFKIQHSVNWDEPGLEIEKNYTSQARSLHSFMTPFVSKNPRSAYLNCRGLDIGINHNDKNRYNEGIGLWGKVF